MAGGLLAVRWTHSVDTMLLKAMPSCSRLCGCGVGLVLALEEEQCWGWLSGLTGVSQKR